MTDGWRIHLIESGDDFQRHGYFMQLSLSNHKLIVCVYQDKITRTRLESFTDHISRCLQLFETLPASQVWDSNVSRRQR